MARKIRASVSSSGGMRFAVVPTAELTESDLKPLLKYLKEKGFQKSRIITERFGSYISITERVGYRYPGAGREAVVNLLRIHVRDYNKSI